MKPLTMQARLFVLKKDSGVHTNTQTLCDEKLWCLLYKQLCLPVNGAITVVLGIISRLQP